MQELQFVQDDSDPHPSVLRAVDDQEFFLAVTDELTEFLDIAVELSAQDAPSDTGTTNSLSGHRPGSTGCRSRCQHRQPDSAGSTGAQAAQAAQALSRTAMTVMARTPQSRHTGTGLPGTR